VQLHALAVLLLLLLLLGLLAVCRGLSRCEPCLKSQLTHLRQQQQQQQQQQQVLLLLG
jgi:hypothetical protein